MSDTLPTLGQVISEWLGFQLPSIPLPQTIKNLDKAISILLLASGKNIEARIKNNTAKIAAAGKINVEEMFDTAEEQRKFRNKAETVRVALEDLSNPDEDSALADKPIDEDWLNLYSRIVEDKNSEAMQILFGKILAGEIKRPGSYSLRTVSVLATISNDEAKDIVEFLSYALDSMIIPFDTDKKQQVLNHSQRLSMEEIGLAGHPAEIGGATLTYQIFPRSSHVATGTTLVIAVENQSGVLVKVDIPGQPLTNVARELMKIVDLRPTDIEFMKRQADKIADRLRKKHRDEIEKGLLRVVVGTVLQRQGDNVSYNRMYISPAKKPAIAPTQ